MNKNVKVLIISIPFLCWICIYLTNEKIRTLVFNSITIYRLVWVLYKPGAYLIRSLHTRIEAAIIGHLPTYSEVNMSPNVF